MIVQVLTSVAKKGDAVKIAKVLLDKKLAACVQVFPAESFYWWKGRKEKAREWICAIKTRGDAVKKVRAVIKKNHSYELPEIIFWKVDGDKNYLAWVKREAKS